MPFTTINNARLWYDVAGEGEPLLLHHGYTACRENWQPVADLLSDRYKVILMECRGAGESEDTEAGYNLAQLAQDVLGLLDHLAIDQVNFAGHSMGGGIGYILGTKHPDRLARLILMAPIPSGGTPAPDAVAINRRIKARNENDRAFFLAQELAAYFRSDVQTQAWANHRVDQLIRVSEKHIRDIAESMHSLQLEKEIADMGLPTLMLAGGADGLLAANLADFQRLPNAGLHVCSRAGHDVGVHEPAAVASAIHGFMQNGPVSARILMRRAGEITNEKKP